MAGPGRGLVALPIARALLLSLALPALMASVSDASPAKSTSFTGVALSSKDAAVAADRELWWHNAIVYQIYPRSFMDSDGDGIGDLNGITSQLEYLKDIGVGAVWLSPFYPSPQADFGYDISDFKNVDPTYGTLEDFAKMANKIHELGMKLVVDLVPNHSSDEHEWFKKSEAGDADYKDYYVWRKGTKDANGKPVPPNNWVSHFRKSAWTYSEKRQEFYLHQFMPQQPDLNYESEKVVQEMKDVFSFWMGQGVDGFRVDALPFLFESNFEKDEPKLDNPNPDLTELDYDYYAHPYTMDMPGTYDMLQQWRQLVDTFHDGKDRVIMTECYTTFEKTIAYYGTKEKPGAHFTFNFQFISSINKNSAPQDFKRIIDQWMGAMDDWRWPNWLVGNHDNSRFTTRFPGMTDIMTMITLTLPGTAMTYYGEEIGMTDAHITWEQTRDPQALRTDPTMYMRVSRDPERTPMQWDDTKNAGFSTHNDTWLPTNPDYWERNVKAQRAARRSHLKVYKDLAEARKTPTMKGGSNVNTAILGSNSSVLAITRALGGADTFITLVNLGSWEQTIRTSDLISEGGLKVYTAGVNSKLEKGSVLPLDITLRGKEGVVLTTAAPSPDPVPTYHPPNSGASSAASATALMSFVLALMCLLR